MLKFYMVPVSKLYVVA